MAANSTVELWMAVDNTYQRALTIPLNTCERFAIFPIPWLSYLGFTICGAEGYVSNSPDGPQVTLRPIGSPVIPPGIYYYITAGDPRWLDAHVMDDRASYGSAHSACRMDFRTDLIARDGTCLLTGANPLNCQACHIIPHSRGDMYIMNLADHREEDLEPPLEGINDTRNGLLLHSSLHRPFGDSWIAFLRTPNHTMDVADVGHVVQPNGVNIDLAVAKRLTLQHFNNIDSVVDTITPHNCDARLSDSDEWPPDLLFDVAYGCAALESWGDPAFEALIQEVSNGIGGRGRGRGRSRGGNRGGGSSRHGGQAQADKRISDRAERAASRAKQKDQVQSGWADVVLALWTRNAKKGRRQAEVVKADRTRDKVQTWLDSTTT